MDQNTVPEVRAIPDQADKVVKVALTSGTRLRTIPRDYTEVPASETDRRRQRWYVQEALTGTGTGAAEQTQEKGQVNRLPSSVY